jgi:purine catabolism regulator
MLTVADALQFEDFAGAKVVAGERGLGRPVRWVHNAAVPDAPDWLNGGELVLTTAINMPETQEDQCQYVLGMVKKNVAGLAIAVGRYIPRVPDYLLNVADSHDFPLIEIPYTVRFVDLVKSINERISQQNMATVTRALDIQQVLTQIVLEGGGLKELAKELAGLIRQSISIENERFEAFASENIAAVDEARRYTLRHGRTNPLLVQALEERNILPEIRRTLRPVFIPQMPDVGLEMERILAPIVVHGEIYGYVWVIADDRPLTELDQMAIQSAATIAALMMLHQEAVQNAETSLKGNLLSRLIQGEAGREAVLNDQALRYGIDLRMPFGMLLIEQPNSSSGRLAQLYRRVNSLAALNNWPVVVGQFAGQVVLLAQVGSGRDALDLRALADQIYAEFSAEKIRIGLSGTHRGADCVGTAHQECHDVLHIQRRLKSRAPCVSFEDLGYLHTLHLAGANSLNSNPYVPGVRKLLQEQHTELFNTLEAYLDSGGNSVQTAKALHIHRSTLNYRLQRIEEISAYKLDNSITRTNLQVVLKLLRLFEVE